MRRAWLMATCLVGAMTVSLPASARSEVFFAKMSPDQMVPASSSTARAEIALQVDDEKNVVCYLLKWDGEDEPTALHLHRGNPGSEGPVMVDLGPPDYNKSGCARADHAIVAYINDVPEAHYVDMHTKNFPNGAVRGQMTPSEGRSTPRTNPANPGTPPPPPPQPGASTTVSTSSPPASQPAAQVSPETAPPAAAPAPAPAAAGSPPARAAAGAPSTIPAPPAAAPGPGGATSALTPGAAPVAGAAGPPAAETAGSASAAATPTSAPPGDDLPLELANRSSSDGSDSSSAGIAVAAVAALALMGGAAAYGLRRRRSA